MEEKVNKEHVTLFLIIALTQLNKEYVDELKETNYYVRDLKREFNRRRSFDKKKLDPYLEEAFQVSSEDILNAMGELERNFEELCQESIEKLLIAANNN